MQVSFRRIDWEYSSPFRIAYRTWTHSETVLVELSDGKYCGRGEGFGVPLHGESVESLLDQLAAVQTDLRRCRSRAELQELLPPGGARNAVDCAFWDLEAKRSGRRAWELVEFTSRPITTDYTLSVDTPQAMSRAALAAAQYSVLKLKLNGECDVERVTAVRCVRPDALLTVDANQAWNEQQLEQWVPQLAELGVRLIEQPLPVGKDQMLAHYRGPIPLCADESCETVDSLSLITGKYQYINIKLDKCGGLTGALRLAAAAAEQGLKLMVGCMGGSSLAMAPAFIVAQVCDFADLDAPLLAKSDMPNGIRYEGSRMFAPDARLWG